METSPNGKQWKAMFDGVHHKKACARRSAAIKSRALPLSEKPMARCTSPGASTWLATSTAARSALLPE